MVAERVVTAPDALFDDEEDVVDHAGGEGAVLNRVQLYRLADTLSDVETERQGRGRRLVQIENCRLGNR